MQWTATLSLPSKDIPRTLLFSSTVASDYHKCWRSHYESYKGCQDQGKCYTRKALDRLLLCGDSWVDNKLRVLKGQMSLYFVLCLGSLYSITVMNETMTSCNGTNCVMFEVVCTFKKLFLSFLYIWIIVFNFYFVLL